MDRPGTRQVNNPNRVPDTITALDGPQAGAPRIIHPVAIRVGTTIKETPMVSRIPDNPTFVVPKDGTYMDRRGNPIKLYKGDRLSLARAAQFEAFDVTTEGKQLSGLTPARSENSAPENRMEPAPETPEDGQVTPENREGYEVTKAREEAERNAQEDADAAPDADEAVDLGALNRDQLIAEAERRGIENPDKIGNMEQIRAAIAQLNGDSE